MESLLWEQFGFDLAVPEKIIFLQGFLGAFKHTTSLEAPRSCMPWFLWSSTQLHPWGAELARKGCTPARPVRLDPAQIPRALAGGEALF